MAKNLNLVPKLNAAYNTPEKELSRVLLIDFIQKSFTAPVDSMLELLGGGEGASFYATHVKPRKIYLVEQEKIPYTDWMKYFYEGFKKQFPGTIPYGYNGNLATFFDVYSTAHKSIDIINLDFCSWFYKQGKHDTPNAPGNIIQRIFNDKLISDGGILLCTFKLSGWGVTTIKHRVADPDNIVSDENKIIEWIVSEALLAGISINEEVHSYTYESTRKSVMVNLGFKIHY